MTPQITLHHDAFDYIFPQSIEEILLLKFYRSRKPSILSSSKFFPHPGGTDINTSVFIVDINLVLPIYRFDLSLLSLQKLLVSFTNFNKLIVQFFVIFERKFSKLLSTQIHHSSGHILRLY